MIRTMILEGTVTNINEQLLTFELNQKITIHLGLVLAQNPDQGLPKVADTIKIKLPHIGCTKSVVLSNGDSIENSSSLVPVVNGNYFLETIKEFQLGICDLLQIEQTFRLLENNFEVKNVTNEKLVISLIRVIIENNNKILPKFTLKFIRQCKYVDDDDGNYPKDLPYWTFGNHLKGSKYEYLIGFLYVGRAYGVIYITDFIHNIRCILTNKNGELNISDFVNKCVLIKNYTIITEIYKEMKIETTECVLVDLRDILIVHSIEEGRKLLYDQTISVPLKFVYNLNLIIVNKGSVALSSNNSSECWLDVRIIENKDSRSAYLCLTLKYLKIIPLLEEGSLYKLYHNCVLKKKMNRELYKLNPSYNQYILESDGIFVLIEKQSQIHCKTTNLKSFQATIRNKKFMKPLVSRTERKTVVPYFGTPGTQTHLLELSIENQFETVDLYLNNWESLSLPFGLIPNTKIIVKNVALQQGKRGNYYKSTAMTSIELLSYEPLIQFESVSFNGPDWGLPYFLSAGINIPTDTFIWGTITSLTVIYLKIKSIVNNDFEIEFILLITDHMGSCKVLANEASAKKLLRLLLDIEVKMFEKFCKALAVIGFYEYRSSNQQNIKANNSELATGDLFETNLTNHLDIINNCIVQLDLKCIRMHPRPQVNVVDSLWLLVDVRKS